MTEASNEEVCVPPEAHTVLIIAGYVDRAYSSDPEFRNQVFRATMETYTNRLAFERQMKIFKLESMRMDRPR